MCVSGGGGAFCSEWGEVQPPPTTRPLLAEDAARPPLTRCKFFSLTETPEDYTLMVDDEGFKGGGRSGVGRRKQQGEWPDGSGFESCSLLQRWLAGWLCVPSGGKGADVGSCPHPLYYHQGLKPLEGGGHPAGSGPAAGFRFQATVPGWRSGVISSLALSALFRSPPFPPAALGIQGLGKEDRSLLGVPGQALPGTGNQPGPGADSGFCCCRPGRESAQASQLGLGPQPTAAPLCALASLCVLQVHNTETAFWSAGVPWWCCRV